MVMPRLSHHNNSSNNSNSNNVDNNRARVLAMGPKRVLPSVGNVRWRGIERGQTTFIIRVGKRGNTKRPPRSLLLIRLAFCVGFVPFHTLHAISFSFFFCTLLITYLSRSHSHTPSSITHLSHSFFWGSHCISKHVLNCIVYVLPTYRLPPWCFLSCNYSPFSPPHPVPLFGAFACSRGGGRCFVLSCSCLVTCLVAF